MLPIFKKTAKRYITKLWDKKWWFFMWVIWELSRARLSGWANANIDSGVKGAMAHFAGSIEEYSTYPLTWTIIAVIIVLVTILIHAYWEEQNNKDHKTIKKAPKEAKLTVEKELEPPEPQNRNPFDVLAEECKNADATYIKLKRKPSSYLFVWIFYLEKMRNERNAHDIDSLIDVIGPAACGGGRCHEEVLYTINCLNSRGYITFEKVDAPWNGIYINQNIKFNTKYDELLKGITLFDNGTGISMKW